MLRVWIPADHLHIAADALCRGVPRIVLIHSAWKGQQFSAAKTPALLPHFSSAQVSWYNCFAIQHPPIHSDGELTWTAFIAVLAERTLATAANASSAMPWIPISAGACRWTAWCTQPWMTPLRRT